MILFTGRAFHVGRSTSLGVGVEVGVGVGVVVWAGVGVGLGSARESNSFTRRPVASVDESDKSLAWLLCFRLVFCSFIPSTTYRRRHDRRQAGRKEGRKEGRKDVARSIQVI